MKKIFKYLKDFFNKIEITTENNEEVINFILSDLDKISRIELIDNNGRQYVKKSNHLKVLISIQDDNRTLKIFIDEK